MASVISANPPPDVAHIVRHPACAAPMIMFDAAISSSTCRTMMPTSRAFFAIQCNTPVAGLIG